MFQDSNVYTENLTEMTHTHGVFLITVCVDVFKGVIKGSVFGYVFKEFASANSKSICGFPPPFFCLIFPHPFACQLYDVKHTAKLEIFERFFKTMFLPPCVEFAIDQNKSRL